MPASGAAPLSRKGALGWPQRWRPLLSAPSSSSSGGAAVWSSICGSYSTQSAAAGRIAIGGASSATRLLRARHGRISRLRSLLPDLSAAHTIIQREYPATPRPLPRASTAPQTALFPTLRAHAPARHASTLPEPCRSPRMGAPPSSDIHPRAHSHHLCSQRPLMAAPTCSSPSAPSRSPPRPSSSTSSPTSNGSGADTPASRSSRW